jgi:hypothetical protein
MSSPSKPAQSPFTAPERDLLRRELCRHFGQDPAIADGIFLRTWRGGERRNQPKIPPAVQTMLERGLLEVRVTQRGPRAFFTAAGLAALPPAAHGPSGHGPGAVRASAGRARAEQGGVGQEAVSDFCASPAPTSAAGRWRTARAMTANFALGGRKTSGRCPRDCREDPLGRSCGALRARIPTRALSGNRLLPLG